jgi:HlyD family secretion protein
MRFSRHCSIVLVCVSVVLAAAGTLPAAEEAQTLTLVEALPFGASSVSATGRVGALVCAKIGARVSGTIAEFAKDASGQILDAGMSVKAGDVLFRLDETTFQNVVALADASLKSAQANLDNLTAKAREERLEQLRQAVAELDVRVADQEREEQRYRRLVEEEKTLPARRLEEAQTQLASTRALRKIAQARLAELENGPTKTEVAIAQAVVHQAQTSLKAAQDDLRDTTVRAPFDALITRRFKSPGDYATGTPHTEIIELTSIDQLEVELRLPEAYYKLVQAGKTLVSLRSPVLERELRLPVGRVVAAIDPATGTFAVRVPIPPAQRDGIVPGVFVTADLRLEGQPLGVLVPLRAIVENSGEGKDSQAAVFVAQDGKMVRKVVEIGDRLTESAIIKSGLARGEKVLVGPVDAMKDGAPLPEYLAKAGTR